MTTEFVSYSGMTGMYLSQCGCKHFNTCMCLLLAPLCGMTGLLCNFGTANAGGLAT